MSSYNISSTSMNDGRTQQPNSLLLSINPNLNLLNQAKLQTTNTTGMMSTLQIPSQYNTADSNGTPVTTFQQTLAPPTNISNINPCQSITPTPPPPTNILNSSNQQLQTYMLQQHNNTNNNRFNIVNNILGNNINNAINNNGLTIQLNKNNNNNNSNNNINNNSNNKQRHRQYNNNNNKQQHNNNNNNNSNKRTKQMFNLMPPSIPSIPNISAASTPLSNGSGSIATQFQFNNTFDNSSLTPSLLQIPQNTNSMNQMIQNMQHLALNQTPKLQHNNHKNNSNNNHMPEHNLNGNNNNRFKKHYHSQRLYRKKPKQNQQNGMSVVDENDTDPNLVQCQFCSEYVTSSALPHHSDACGGYPKPCNICGKNIKQQLHVKHRKEMHPNEPPIDDPNLLKLQTNNESDTDIINENDENNKQKQNNNRRNNYNNYNHRHRNNNNNMKGRNRMNNNRKSYNNRNKRYNNNNNNRMNNNNHNQYNRNRKSNRHNQSYNNNTQNNMNQEEVKVDVNEQQAQHNGYNATNHSHSNAPKQSNQSQTSQQCNDSNVWCPYYQYGCRSYFPKSQIQNHLRAYYREHLIIQTAEMYKLVNLIITTMASFPTFENLMQQQPIDLNNNIVSNSLNYISQYNSHLASLMSQQSQQQQHSDTHSQRTNNTNNINNNSQLNEEQLLQRQELLNAHLLVTHPSSTIPSVAITNNKSNNNIVRRNNSRHSINSGNSNENDCDSSNKNINKCDDISTNKSCTEDTKSDNINNNNKITNEMEKFASNLRLPRPQLHTQSLINDVRTSTPDPPCPIDKFPFIINVNGRLGFNCEINGNYHLLPNLHRNRPCYKKFGSTWCIRWNSQKTEWMIDCDGLKDDNIACARVQQDCIHPALVNRTWKVYNNPRNIEDNNVQITIVCDTRNNAIKYCKNSGIEWPSDDFESEQISIRSVNNRYHPIRQTSHSRSYDDCSAMDDQSEDIKQQINDTSSSNTIVTNSINNGYNNGGYNNGYNGNDNMNMSHLNDEELQQHRQRHQDQYLESMHTHSHSNGYNNNNGNNGKNNGTGTVLSTVSISHSNNSISVQRNIINNIETSPACSIPSQHTQYSMISSQQANDTQSNTNTSHLIPVNEETHTISDSDNMSTRATTLEVYDPNVLSDNIQNENENNYKKNKNKNNNLTMPIRSKPPLKNNNFIDVSNRQNNNDNNATTTFANIVSGPQSIKQSNNNNNKQRISNKNNNNTNSKKKNGNDNPSSKSARRKKRRKNNKKTSTKSS